jgi:sulfate permease, SulP family
VKKLARPDNSAGEFWGGLAAMLVALPSAIAFGVTVFAPLGGSFGAQGAAAGILGAGALGLVASLLGGTKRLISAPSAPAAAVMSALVVDLVRTGTQANTILMEMAVVAMLCGVFQIIFAAMGLGRLIKYMPYPVVSGYLSGVGLIIITSQLPKLLGVPNGTDFISALQSVSLWNWQGILVGVITAAVMVLAPKVTRIVPAAILGLASGVLTYFGLALMYPSLLTLAENKSVVGPITSFSGGFLESIAGRIHAFGTLDSAQMTVLLVPALTLAVLLSIDTLKTCVVLDTLTRSRHDSNRELMGQGFGNIASMLAGGIPGSGTMGATLVNISSGAQRRWSGVMEGLLAMLAFLLLGNLIAWIPIASLAAIMLVIGVRMIDRESFRLLQSRSTVLDFAVIVTVVAVAASVDLIAASGTGLALAIMLFIREQIRESVVRRKIYGNEMFSKQVRLKEESAVLEKYGDRTVIFELQGSLFFGTSDQLYSALETELKTRQYVILDMRRVQSVDVSAAHMLEQIERILRDRGGFLIFSHMPRAVPSGQDMERYFSRVGLVRAEHQVLMFGHRDEALEWVENQVLKSQNIQVPEEKLLQLHEIELLKGRKPETIAELERCMEQRSFKESQTVFKLGDRGDELFLIRRGSVRIMLPLEGRTPHHLSTFGRGHFFGEMAFLDNRPRSADAIAIAETDTYVLSRSRFNQLQEEHKMLANNLLESLATSLAHRLRHSNHEISILQDL